MFVFVWLGEAHLETAGDPDGNCSAVFPVCQIYAVRYAGGDLLQLADPVLRTGHELSEKGEPRETDRHVRDLGTADPDAALYAAVSGSGLLISGSAVIKRQGGSDRFR